MSAAEVCVIPKMHLRRITVPIDGWATVFGLSVTVD